MTANRATLQRLFGDQHVIEKRERAPPPKSFGEIGGLKSDFYRGGFSFRGGDMREDISSVRLEVE